MLNTRMMTPEITSKLPRVGTTIFTEMSALAREHGAVNLSQGFPDFACSPELQEALCRAVKAGHNQYAPMQGILPLREKIGQKIEKLYFRRYDPQEEITVVPGGTIGIFTAITAVVNPGDEVIVIEPAYDCYVPAIELCGGIPVYSSLTYPDFSVNWDHVASLISPATRMIILNTPHNPGTSALNSTDLGILEKITSGNNILILSDEVYEHILFDGEMHQSMALSDQLASRSFIVSSLGKTYHVTGWKTGYVCAPASLMKEFRKVYQFNAFSSFTPAQYAFLDMLEDPDTYLSVAGFYQAKRDKMKHLLAGSKFRTLPCAGSYFQLLDYSAWSDMGDYELARHLTTEHKIATIPLSSFYHDRKDQKLLRICFAKEDETLEKAAKILNSLT